MIRDLLGQDSDLIRCNVAVAAVEASLVLPIFLFLVLGIFKISEVLYARSAMNNAVEEASRYATIYPTPTDAEIATRFHARSFGFVPSRVTPTISRGAISATVKYVEVKATWSHSIDLILFTVGPITISAKRRVYMPT